MKDYLHLNTFDVRGQFTTWPTHCDQFVANDYSKKTCWP